MKFLQKFPLAKAIVILLLLTACQKNSKNEIPNISILDIENEMEIQQGTKLTISVDVEDSDGYIEAVEFLINNSVIGTINEPPYSYDWYTTNEVSGSHQVSVIAIDNSGGSGTDVVTVIINERGETGTVSDIEGNTYKTIRIGEQWWMAENLKVTKLNDGDEIEFIDEDTVWANLKDEYSEIAYCYYNNNENGEKDIYGALYTYAAAQKVCPTNWHLPSREEWEILDDFISNDEHAGKEGLTLKASNGWNENGNGTDYYGFNGLPSGERHNLRGVSLGAGRVGTWWCDYEWGDYMVPVIHLMDEIDYIYKDNGANSYGFSVRCVKD